MPSSSKCVAPVPRLRRRAVQPPSLPAALALALPACRPRTRHFCSRLSFPEPLRPFCFLPSSPPIPSQLPEQNQLVIVDVGSLCGLRVLQRSSASAAPEEACEPTTAGSAVGGTVSSAYEADCSLPGCRRPLLVGAAETALVHLGDLRAGCTIVLNPKLCLVCMSQPRQVTFNPCGHFACCADCAERVLAAGARGKCPLCRTAITRADGARLAQTLCKTLREEETVALGRAAFEHFRVSSRARGRKKPLPVSSEESQQ